MSAVLNQPAPGVKAEVQYVAAPERSLHCYTSEPPVGMAETNASFEPHTVEILDVRQRRSPAALDLDGAELLSRPSGVRRYYDADELRQRYYPESAELIRAATGAREVVVFDHNIRRAGASERAEAYDPQRPVFHVHTDFTARSARRRAETVLGRPRGGHQRFAAINLWRPITAPLRDSPLAICEASSVSTEDLVPVELRYADRTGEIYYVAYNPAHRWYYAPDMQTDEVWLFKNYDSAKNIAARFTPHTAFAEPAAHRKVLPRESIEVRAFAVYDP